MADATSNGVVKENGGPVPMEVGEVIKGDATTVKTVANKDSEPVPVIVSPPAPVAPSLSGHLVRIWKEAAYQRRIRQELLREKLKRLREEIKNANNVAGEKERGPLRLFSEEIWTMILDGVDNPEGRLSCYRTCKLFNKLIGDGAKSQYLFGKVIPMVACYLNKQEILQSRKICQQWRTGVDEFLEQGVMAIDQPFSDTIDQLIDNMNASKIKMKDYPFEKMCSIPPQNASHITTREGMKVHGKNPFIGRCVAASALPPPTPEPDLPNPEPPGPGFFEDFKQFFTDLGQHIWHLNIHGATQFSLPPSSVYSITVLSLLKCPSLRSLSLSYWDNGTKWFLSESKIREGINSKNPPPDHSHLEHLNVDISNPKALIFQDKLVEKYSGQLKRLDVHFWNDEKYHGLSWESLVELQVIRGNSSKLLTSLLKISAPHLHKLGIRLDSNSSGGGGGPKLEDLIQLMKNLNNLAHLDLKFSHEFQGFSDEQIKNLTPKLIGSGAVTSLELTVTDKDECGFNFLICFPFLRRLLIRYGANASSQYHLDDSDSDFDEPDSSEVYSEEEPESYFDGYPNAVKIKMEPKERVVPAENGDDIEIICLDDDDEDASSKKDKTPASNYPGNWKKNAVLAHTNGLLKEGGGSEAGRGGGGSGNANDSTKANRVSTSSASAEDFVQISKYITGNYRDMAEIKKMYKSNIWELLPYLQLLKICHQESGDPVWNEYTRQGYLKEKNNRRSLLEERLHAVRKIAGEERAKRKEALQKRLNELRAVIAGDKEMRNGDDVPDIFSEEIFSSVFNYLDRPDILNCRLVSTSWRSRIDKFLEEYFTIKDLEPKLEAPFTGSHHNFRKEFQFEYTFEIPSNPTSSQGHDRFRDKIMANSDHRLIGRTVQMSIDLQPFVAKTKEEWQQLLTNLGHQMWHVNVLGATDNIYLNPPDYQFLCQEIMTKCPNLRRLTLTPADFGRAFNRTTKIHISSHRPEVSQHPHLETLEVYDNNLDILPIQDKLLEIHSSQLKCVAVSFWNHVFYHQYSWTNLKELLMLDRNCETWLDSLNQLNAPNLTGLYICLSGQRPKLEMLMKLTSRYPKLDKIQLQLLEGRSGLDAEEHVAITSGLTFPAGLTCLELVLPEKCDLSFDFLIYFLNLKRLSIQLGQWEKYGEEAKKTESKEDTEVVPQFIAIVEYCPPGGDGKKMYKSNVWEMLPSLQVLDLYRISTGEKVGTRNIYTRQGYTHFNQQNGNSG